MEVTLPVDLRLQVEKELEAGNFGSVDELIESAVRGFLDDQRRSARRLATLRDIGDAVEHAGLYDRVTLDRK